MKSDDYLRKAYNAREKLKTMILQYKELLEVESKVRDLGKEKVKNASVLKIEIPKFYGYDSALDFYSFKSEFEKLISPLIQVRFLPDYLKNNYLGGQALELVKELHKMQEIWHRLKSSFGNVRVLLNNKLETVENLLPLWKIRSDEKLILTVTKLINSMKELGSLAEKHDIQQILFHPSNLSKIYELIGKKRQTKFLELNMGIELSIQDEWDRLIDFLDNELKLKEKMFDFSLKIEKHEGSKLKNCDGKHKNFSAKSSKSETIHPEGKILNTLTDFSKAPKCALCQKEDHIPTITKNG